MVEQCPDCGAQIAGGKAGCQALWHELVHYRGVAQGPAFDAYCMQHLEQYCKSAKSYAAHLTRLCCGIEYQGDGRIYAAIQQWLNGSLALEKPMLLTDLGAMTIVDINAGQTSAEQIELVNLWVNNVWSAYASQHELARAWIKKALLA